MISINVATASAWAAHVLTWAPGVFFAFRPVYQGVSVVPSRPGEPANEAVALPSATLIEVNSLYVILLLLLPILLTAIALSALRVPNNRQTLRKALLYSPGALLLGFCIVGIFSIGLFYLPAAAALLIAGIADIGGKKANEPI